MALHMPDKGTLRKCKESVSNFFKRFSKSSSGVGIGMDYEEKAQDPNKSYFGKHIEAWGGSLDSDDISVFSSSTFTPLSPISTHFFDEAFAELDQEDNERDLSLLELVHLGLVRRGSESAQLLEESLHELEKPILVSPVVPKQALPNIVSYMESAKAQLSKAQNLENDISARNVAFQTSVILAEQAFVLGDRDAAKFLRDAYGGIKDVTSSDLVNLQKWTKVTALLKKFDKQDEAYMNELVRDYGSIIFEEQHTESILDKKREEFTTKYSMDLIPVYSGCDYDDLEAAIDTALVCYISRNIQEPKLSDWMGYLDNASIGFGIDISIVNEFLATHNVQIIGEASEA
jgi:hypothetical protein